MGYSAANFAVNTCFVFVQQTPPSYNHSKESLVLLILRKCQCVFFLTFARFSPAHVGFFARSRLQGTQGARLYTKAQAWVPGGLRGARSGRSKSQNLASIHGVTFCGAKAEQDNGKPTCQLFYSTVVKALYLVAATVQEQSHIKFAWTTTSVCGHCISVSAVCCNTCACV